MNAVKPSNRRLERYLCYVAAYVCLLLLIACMACLLIDFEYGLPLLPVSITRYIATTLEATYSVGVSHGLMRLSGVQPA